MTYTEYIISKYITILHINLYLDTVNLDKLRLRIIKLDNIARKKYKRILFLTICKNFYDLAV